MKRWLSVLLVLCVLLTALPLTAMAAGKTAADFPKGHDISKLKTSDVIKLKLTAVGRGANKVKLSWKSDGKSTWYEIYRNGWYIGSTTSKTYTDSNASSGSTNTYYVYGFNSSSSWNQSYGTVSIYPLSVPSSVKVTKDGKYARLSWKSVKNAKSYEIWYSTSKNGTYKKAKSVSSDKTNTKWENSNVGKKDLYFKVRAVRSNGKSDFCSPVKLGAKSDPTPTPITGGALHTLFIFEESVPGATPMRTSSGDMSNFRKILGKATPKGLPWGSWNGGKEHIKKNLSKSKIKSAISSMAKHSTKNDVCLVYISTHGDNSITSGEYAGIMALSDGDWMTFGELAAALKKIPGHVVVVLSSCGSGSSIGKGAGNDKAWQNAAIQAFKNVNTYMTETTVGEDGSKVGELKVSKFHVICAAKGGTSGIYYYDKFHYLVKWMADCVASKGSVTMKTLNSYLTNKGNNTRFDMEDGPYYMHPQVWPVDDYKIFWKIGK